ncbi:MAG: PH domain-containing protein [Patescibacteria group bacterium]
MEEFELEPGEQVMRTVRKHWLVFLGMLLPYIFLALIPLFLPGIFTWATRAYPAFGDSLVAFNLMNPLVRVGLGVWWLILWIGAFNAFTSYFLNVWIITSQRIVHIQQFRFFERRVSSFLLVRVQDVTTNIDGILADLFGFGCVQVETAGTASSKFVMDGVADPVGMRDLIMREIALLHPPASGV